MAWSSLDTRPWNLGALALGVGACGALVPPPADTDGDEESDDVGPESSAESTPSATDTIGPGCGGGPPCPPNYTCIDGYCQYDDYCDGECGGYGCYSHEDCPSGEYCDNYGCRSFSYLYDCGGGVADGQVLIVDVGNPVSLAFADTNDDGYEDIVLFVEGTSWVLKGPDASDAIPVELSGSNTGHVVGVDIDGVGPREITFSVNELGSLVTISAVDVPVMWDATEPALAWPVAGDFDGDSLEDVAGQIGGEILYLFSNGTGLTGVSSLGIVAPSMLAVGDLGVLPGDDVVYADSTIYVAELSDGGGRAGLEEAYTFSDRTPIVGDFNGDGRDDIAAISPESGGYYGVLATWGQIAPGEFVRNDYRVGPELSLSADGVYATAVGDFDGDAVEEVVVGGEGTLTVLFGAIGGGGSFGCWREIPIDGTARLVAAGDLDGDGHDDIAWSDGAAITRVRLSG